jgi:hypothetical protein
MLKDTREQERERGKGGRGREIDMPGGLAPPVVVVGAVLLGHARLAEATVSRSLFICMPSHV